MTKRILAAAMVFAAVLLCACGNQNGPESKPSPTSTVDFTVLWSEIVMRFIKANLRKTC
jgi:ABC-type phosphate transport system substrate-binding protein